MLNPRLPVAVALAAVVAAGFVWGPGATVVRDAVIRLAIIGSHPFDLDRFYRQDVAWHACRAGSDDPTGRMLDDGGARCAEVTVPLDYRKPRGRTIKLAVARRLATDRDHREGTLLVNTGGPGGSRDGVLAVLQGLKPEMAHGSSAVAARYDLVGVDPRFFGRSTRLGCDWPTGTAVRSADLASPDRRSFDASVARAKDLAARCAKAKDLLPYASTRTIAKDLDVVRSTLNEEHVSYLGWSYGGYLGAVYAQSFPQHVRRVVLDSSPDPVVYGPNPSRSTGAAADAAGLRNWARWAARRNATYRLGASADQVLATVERIRRAAGAGLTVGAHRVDAAMLPGLLLVVVDTKASYAAFSAKVQVLSEAASGQKVNPTPDLAEYFGQLASTDVQPGFDAGLAVRCADRPASRDPETYFRDIQVHLRDEPLYGPLTRNVTPCAFWPADSADRPIRIATNLPALLVGASGDPASPYVGQQALHRDLTRSRLVTLQGAFRHGVYLFDGNSCVDKLVDQYLLAGTLPSTDPTCTSS